MSRSPEQISTSIPAAVAWVARVAMMSSASTFGFSSTATFIAARTSWMSGTWPRNGCGVSARPALYSAYSSVRKVTSETSNATARWVGCSSASAFSSMERKP